MTDIPLIDPLPALAVRGAAESATAYREQVDAITGEDGVPRAIEQWNDAIEVLNPALTLAGQQADQVQAANDFAEDIYEQFAAQSLPALVSTSTTNLTVSIALLETVVPITLESGKIYWPDLNVYGRDDSNAANFIVGPIVTYNPANGSATIKVKNVGAGGAVTAWHFYPAGPRDITLDRPVYEAIGSPISTASGTAWTINPLPTKYADLFFEFDGLSHNRSGGGNDGFQVEIHDGTTWGSPITLTGVNIPPSEVNSKSIKIDGYNKKDALLVSTWGAVFIATAPTAAGIKGVRFSWQNAAPGDAGQIRAWGK